MLQVSPADVSPEVPMVVPEPPSIPAAAIKISTATRLPNASVGKPYCRSVRALFGDQADRVAGISIEVPESCGLSFDEENGTIGGTPTKPGEFKLALAFQLVPQVPGRSA
ncbi:MAG: hypothetical protein EOP84_12890, partial [Verrucomicrobiaceae bacterium]